MKITHNISSFVVLLLFLHVSVFSQQTGTGDISLHLGTSVDDQWQFAGNIKLSKEVRRMGEDFSKIEVIKLRNDDKLLEEEVKNFVPPPVPLLSFTAQWQMGGIQVSWISPKLDARQSLTLQRSTDGLEWTDLYQTGKIPDKLVRNEYMDSTIQIGTNIYRLKQVLETGKINYSNKVAVEVLPEITHTTYLYPNPLIFGTLIELELFRAAEVEVKILDQDHKELATIYSEICSMGKHFIELNMDGLPKGKYLCSIKSGTTTSFRTLVK